MIRLLIYILAFGVAFHGVIHLMGLIAYWPLGTLAELPYKTTLLDGRWSVGSGGMRLYSVLWLLAAVGFVVAAVGLVLRWDGWWTLLLATTLLSLLVTALDWHASYRGAVIDLILLAGLLLWPRLAVWLGSINA